MRVKENEQKYIDNLLKGIKVASGECKWCKQLLIGIELYKYKGFCKDCFYELGLDKIKK